MQTSTPEHFLAYKLITLALFHSFIIYQILHELLELKFTLFHMKPLQATPSWAVQALLAKKLFKKEDEKATPQPKLQTIDTINTGQRATQILMLTLIR